MPLNGPLVWVFHSSSLSWTSVTQEPVTDLARLLLFQLGGFFFYSAALLTPRLHRAASLLSPNQAQQARHFVTARRKRDFSI